MTKDDPLLFNVMNEIGIINQLSNSVFSQVLPHKLTIAQFSILNHFVRLRVEKKSPASLASAFQVSRPTMTNTLMRLERAGFVEITPDPDDKRGKRVSITDSGRAARGDALARLAIPMTEAQAIIGTELLSEIQPLLAEMRVKLDAMRD